MAEKDAQLEYDMNDVVNGYDKFLKLRRYVLDALGKMDMEYCKSYEGSFELLINYPNYFDENCGDTPTDNPDCVTINLHCYVLGPRRHYEWDGKSIQEAVVKARKDIEQWIKQELEEGDSQ